MIVASLLLLMKTVFLVGIILITVFAFASLPLISAKTPPEKLESVLYQLTQTQNHDEFAKTRGLHLEDGKVRVVIELYNASDTIPDGYGAIIETRHENLVQALVPINSLMELSKESSINFIRAPLPAYPQKTPEYETQIPLTLIWMYIGIIIIVVIMAVTAVVCLKRTGLKR